MRYAQPIEARVRGDWMPEGESYPALVDADWNGWAVPSFDRETAERVVADQAKLIEDADWEGAPTLEWDGDAILYRDPNMMEEDDADILIEPDENGRYPMGLGWCWELEDAPNDPDDPTPAQVMAHTRLAESLKCHSTNRTVYPDGSAVFAVWADLGEQTEDGTKLVKTIARIRIDRDGNATPDSAELRAAGEQLIEAAVQHWDAEPMGEAVDRFRRALEAS